MNKMYTHKLYGQLEELTYDGQSAFYANDVAELLGYSDIRKARNHCESLVKLNFKETKELGLKSNGNHGTYLIGMEDLKIMVSKCDKNSAVDIDTWLCDVLPNYSEDKMVFVRAEHVALDTIEQLLGVTLIRQYKVLDYRIDGYHMESNTAYEIDEAYHSDTRHQKADITRQKAIEDAIGCKFVRIKV